MSEKIINTTKESNEAEIASDQINYEMQFGIPDIKRLLQSAYYHGYRDALLKNRLNDRIKKLQD